MGENFKENFVIDASFILAFLLPDEENKAAEEIFNRYQKGEINLFSTSIITWEVLNGLNAATLSKRISKELSKKLSQNFLKISIDLEETNPLEVFNLGQNLSISIYDATYLYLAKSKHYPLLTLDKTLRKLVS